MMFGDPLLVIRLLGKGTRRNSRSIRANDADLILRGNGLLGAEVGAAGTLAAFTAAAGLREEGLKPGLVDEVEGAEEGGGEEEVEEDAVRDSHFSLCSS